MAQAEVTCPKCGKTHKVDTKETINITLAPQLKEQIMSGTFFRYLCTDCGEAIYTLYPCMYHDMDRKLLIYVLPGCSSNAPEQMEPANEAARKIGIDPMDPGSVLLGNRYVKRVVGDINGLIEKIKIDDSGLDDRIIEICKGIYANHLMASNPQLQIAAAYFENGDGIPQFVFLCTDSNTYSSRLTREVYEEISAKVGPALEKDREVGFRFIDGVWVTNFLTAAMDPAAGQQQ